MNEEHSSEVERVLLHVGHASDRAKRAVVQVVKDGADPHVVKALEDTAEELSQVYRRLAQATYYAIPSDDLKLAV
jgi:hypothetical protein